MLCKVKPTQFDKSIGRVKNHPNKTFLSAKLTEAYNEAEQRLLKAESDGRIIDTAYIVAKGVAVASTTGGLLAHAWNYVERCKQKGKYHTALKYSGHVNKLADYLGKTKDGEQIDIHMDDVDEKWMLSLSV
jgi:hypothetical protein